MTRAQWIMAGAALLIVGWFWYSRSNASGQAAQSTAPASSLSITPFYSMASLAGPAYQAGTVPVVSDVGGVTPVNVGDYLSAFTSAPAVMSPTIGLVSEVSNYGGLQSGTSLHGGANYAEASASYGTGMFSAGGSAQHTSGSQNINSQVAVTTGQNITFAS